MIDLELIGNACLKIGTLHRTIMEAFPKENESLLKHLAASSIHLAMFTQDLASIVHGHKIEINKELTDKFLKECGCNINE